MEEFNDSSVALHLVKMRPPCEIVVLYFLPTFRSLVARELIEKHGFSQVEVAAKLGTTQAAISQYLRSKRGEKKLRSLRATPAVQFGAKDIAKHIAKGKLSPFEAIVRLCNLCSALRDGSAICRLHKDSADLPRSCNFCLSLT